MQERFDQHSPCQPERRAAARFHFHSSTAQKTHGTIRATGLAVDGSYLIRIVDEAGHVHFSNAPVAVKAIRLEAVRLNMKTLTLSFNTEYGRQYVVKVSTNLVDWSIEYASYLQAAGWTEYVNTPFTAGPGSKTEVIVPVNGRKQAFFKIQRVDE